MEQKIKKLIEDLKKQERNAVFTTNTENPEAKINVWYVIAKLEEILLEGK